MCDYLNAKTLKFLSLEGLYKALINEKRDTNILNLVIIILLVIIPLNLMIILTE